MSPEVLKRCAPAPRPGIVHLGLGAFFRAFGVPFIEDAMRAGGGDWGVIGVSLRSPATRDALAAQNWAYTSVTLGPDGFETRQIEALHDVLVAPEDPEAVIAALADPATCIVTLTVTEKGYCHIPASGGLNMAHPDIVHDLAHADPVSAPGFLVRALARRRAAGLAPFTVMSCDNLPENGVLTRRITCDLARQMDPELASWIEAEGRFPATMVDRITPATTQADIDTLATQSGILDRAPVFHEPFRQWVVEDSFVGQNRPDFAAAGVTMTHDVQPFEDMKLRMLNGAHSALAYLGYLGGYETISQVMADDVYSRYINVLWCEIIPNVAAPHGVNLDAYAASLKDRFSNPGIQHRTWQIAMDGSQKLPQRLLQTLSEAMKAGRPTEALCLAVAGWMRYVSGSDETGAAIDVCDPLAERLAKVAASQTTPRAKAESLLGVRDVFSNELAKKLNGPVGDAAETIWAEGARGAIRRLVS